MTTPNTLGQQLSAVSMPVVIASDQPAIPVTFPVGGTTDVNLVEYLSAPVGPGNPIDVQGLVAVTNFPAVQPVNDNGGSLTVDDGGGSLTIDAAALPLPAGAATEATLATRATEATLATRLAEATFTGRLPAAAAMADNEANPTLTKIAAYLMALDPAGTWDRLVGNSTSGLRANHERATLIVPVSPAANAGATITLPAAGAGLFHYITHIYIGRHATAALAGGGTLTITTTNLNGLTWRVGNQASITVAIMQPGVLIDSEFVHPLRSAVSNTATTIVLPAPGAAVLWTAWCAYYVGP